tara:strand:- start:421 stop:651 length:231 start_codon:yes stop_codon:yes gene_type:complete
MNWEDIMKDDKIKSLIDKYREKMDLEKAIGYLNDNIFEAYQEFQEDLPDPEMLKERELIKLFREIVLKRIDSMLVE